jgi:DNA-binding response OmpR family regulator
MTSKIILCVLEDDARQIAAIRHVVKLEFPDADLRLAMDGEACLKMLMDDRVIPDLAILDINTPKLNGLEVLARLRQAKQFKQLPIIMFSTSDSDTDRKRANELGATDYVIKPPIRSMGSALRGMVDKPGRMSTLRKKKQRSHQTPVGTTLIVY